MTDKKRYTLLTVSILIGTVFSFFVFKMKRGGELTNNDWLTLGSIFVISLILLISVSIIFKKASKDNME